MAKSASDKSRDSLLRAQINVLRLSESEKLKAEKLLRDLRKKVVAELSNNDPTMFTKTKFQKKRLKILYRNVTRIADANFDLLSKSTQKALIEMGDYVAKSSTDAIDSSTGLKIMTPELSTARIKSVINNSMIDGKLMGEWWGGQSKNFVTRFKSTMGSIMKDFQMGTLEGKALGSMVSQLSGKGELMGYTRRNMEAMVRTSFMQVASDIREETWDDNKDILRGTRWLSTLDLRTTPICRALDGCTWDMNKKPTGKTVFRYRTPPAHWSCRSTTIPETKTYEELLKVKPQVKSLSSKKRAAINGPVSSDVTYDGWLKTQSVEVQQDILGKAKFSLWKKNKLSMSDMVSQSGNPLTIKQLNAKIAKDVKFESMRVAKKATSDAMERASNAAKRKTANRLKRKK